MALHRLGGKQALYAECSKLAKKIRSQKKTPPVNSEKDPGEDYLRQLKALEAVYIKVRSHLVAGNLRLVAAVLKKLSISSMPWEDLMQHGAISLQKAVESFDPTKKVRFSTFGVPVIRGDLIRALENFSNEIRKPSHVWVKMRSYNKVENELCFVLGRAPSIEEMAVELGITVQEAMQLQECQWAPVSLDAPRGEQEEGIPLGETLADPTTQFPGRESSGYHKFISPHAAEFDCVEHNVLKRYAGDGDSEGMEAEEIALAMGLNMETVSGALQRGFQKIMESRKAAKAA